MNNWGIFNRLRPLQIEEIKNKTPIAYLAWGAIEYHGNHNPTGLDTHKAYHMCKDLAKENGGLVFPPISIAANLICSYPGADFPNHSIEFSEKLIQQICEEYFEQLAKEDYKIILLLSGHAGEPHLQILRDTAIKFNEKYPTKYFWTLAEFDILPDSLLVANHSALGETAIQLYYKPNTVDLSCLPKKGTVTLEEHAVSGEDPRPATFYHGKKIVSAFLENATEKITSLKTKYIK